MPDSYIRTGPLGYESGFSSCDCGMSKFGSESSSSSSKGMSANPSGVGRDRMPGRVMPPGGPAEGVHSGRDGEDWKCRSVFGRAMDGVGGIARRGSAPFDGVVIDNPKLGFRFGRAGRLDEEWRGQIRQLSGLRGLDG